MRTNYVNVNNLGNFIDFSLFHRINTPPGICYTNDDQSIYITKINESVYQIDDLTLNSFVRCAKIVKWDNPPAGPFDSTVSYCGKNATHATICNPKDEFKYFNIGHFYCQEHAPEDAVKLPDNYESYVINIGKDIK